MISKETKETEEAKESSDDDLNFGKKNPEINFDYLSSIKNELKNNYYTDISFETKSGIPGIFIAFEKISDYFLIVYYLKKCNEDIKCLKYIEEKDELINKLKQFIEKETFIPKIFEKDNSLLKLLCYDLYLYMVFYYENKILDATLDKNITDYNCIFSLIKAISEIELNVDEKIKINSLDIFYSLFYFLILLQKEIFHLIEIYSYISNKFEEYNYLKPKEFYDLFMENITKKIKIYTKSDSKELISIFLFNETIFKILNDKSIENYSIINLFKNIVPECIRLNENLNLNGKEIYTFIELIKVLELSGKNNNDIIRNIFKLILEASNYEISKHINIYLNKQESDQILLLSENENNIKNEEANILYTNLNKIFKYIDQNLPNGEPLEDDEDEYYDNCDNSDSDEDEIKYEKKIDKRFNKENKYKLIIEIFAQELKKYNNNYYYFIILRNLLLENDGESFEYSKNIFEIILNKYLFQKYPQKKEDIDKFFEKISDESNPFIKNYFYITKHKKLKVFLEEIILQIFGFYLNGYFMKYTDKINGTISYKNLDKVICKDIFEENLELLKESIIFLEKIGNQDNFEKKILASLFCCNFIQIYFYHLVKYIYENKDINIDQLYDYSNIIQIIDGEGDKQTTPFRFSIKILFMRLLYYNFGKRNNKTFENFKKFDFNGRKIAFRAQFKDDKKFEDSNPKLINYSKIFLEDYNLDKTFKYIYDKKDKKIEKNLSKIYYNLSYHSISFISDTSYKAKIITEEEKKIINDNIELVLKKDEEIYNYHYSKLSYYYLSIMTEKLLKILEKEKSNSMFSDEKTKEKILGILMYSFRICFISLITERNEYFYENILFLKNNELFNFLQNNFVPGFDTNLTNVSLSENDFDQNMDSNKKISNLILRFIFYSHLFYSYSMENFSEENTRKFTINKNKTCLETLIKIWDVLEKELDNRNISKAEIFLNLVSKYLPEYLKLYLIKDCNDNNKKNEFENKFYKFIQKCIMNYPEYQKYYIDYSMRYIIQEYNYPLRYKEEIYPFMKYFVVNGKPNIIDIKNKISNENFLLNSIYKNNNYDYDYLTNFRNYNIIVVNITKFLSYYSYYENISSKKINEIKYLKDKIPLLFDLISKNSDDYNLNEIMKANIGGLNNIIKKHYEKYIKFQNQILLKGIRYNYCFKRTYRKMNIQDCLYDENINFNLSSFSKHTFFNSIYSKFITRNSFDKNKKVKYFDYQGFDIDINHLEEELFSILFYRKNIFSFNHFNPIIFRYDGLNKNKDNNIDNTDVIKNYLEKYINEKMGNNLLEQFNRIIGRSDKDKDKYLDYYNKKTKEMKKDYYINNINIKEKENSKKIIEEKIEKIKKLREKDEKLNKKIEELNNNLNASNNNLGELKKKEQNEEITKQIKEEEDKINNLNKEIENKNKEKDENKKLLDENTKKEGEFTEEKRDILSELNKLYDKKKLNELLYKKLNLSFTQLMNTYEKDYVLSEKIVKILLDILFSIQSLFKYLLKYKLSEDIPLFFIYENLPEKLFNSKYIKNIFIQLPNLCIKHLYSLYEYLEVILFPFFLNQINECYSSVISQYTIEHLKMIFNENEFKEKIHIKKNELIEALRKFMCRYLVSSKKSSEVIDKDENLLLLLINKELWDYISTNEDKFIKIKDSLININKLLVEPILVKNTLFLFDILLGLNSPDNNQRSNQYLNNFSNINKNVIDDNIMMKTFEIITEKKEFSKNVESVIDFIQNPERIIEFNELVKIRLEDSNGSLYSLCKFEDDKIITVHRGEDMVVFKYDQKTFRKNHSFDKIEIKGLKDIKDSNQVNCIKTLKDNSIILCCCTPKIIRLTIIKNEAKVIEILDGSSYNCQQFYNVIEFDYNKLIASTNTNIIIWEKKSDNKYSYKQNISTGSETNLVYINENIFVAHVNDNTIRFYDKNFKETGSRVSNVTSRFEPLMMTMLNDELLGVCGSGNYTIYLININSRKIIKEVKFENYSSDYISISTLLDSSIVINNMDKVCFHVKLIKEKNNYDLKIISILSNLCAQTFTFEYLFDEIFLHSCVNGHFYAYLNPNIGKLIDEKSNSKKEEGIIVDEYIIKEIEEQIKREKEKEKEREREEKENPKSIKEKFDSLVPEKVLKNHSKAVTNILILKDGRLASSSDDLSIIIYKKKEYTEQCKIKEHNGAVSYFTQISNDNIVSCSSDKSIKIFKLISEKEYQTLQTLTGHSSTVTKVIEDNNNNLISCSDDHTIKIWNYTQSNQNYSLSKTININDEGSYYNILFIKENEIVSSSYYANYLKFWNINNSNSFKNISMVCGWTSNCMIKYNDNILLVGNYTSTNGIYIVDLQKYEIIRQIEGFKDTNTILNINLDNNNFILVGGNYKDKGYSMVLYEFDINNNSLILIKEKTGIHNSYVKNIVLLDKYLISCSSSNNDNIKFWNIPK